jgi:hypothetical protein
VIRSLLVQLAAVAATEGIPVSYLLESTVLVGLRHKNTFNTRGREAEDDDLARQIGLAVRTMAKRRYRKDLAAGSRLRMLPVVSEGGSDRKVEG